MRRMTNWTQVGLVALALLGVSAAGVSLADSGHGDQGESPTNKGPVTMTGEVVDLMCYLDHGARGAGHMQCAKKCIRKGGPVGLVVDADQANQGDQGAEAEHPEAGPTAYLLIGQHKPINHKLISKAAKQITVRGKLVQKAGLKMLENVQIVETGDVVKDKGEKS